MSSPTEEPAQELKLASLSPVRQESYQLVTLEVHQDSLTVSMPGVFLEITGDVFEQFMEKLMLSPLPLEKGFPLKVVISTPQLLHVMNAQNSSLMRGSGELSITTLIEIPQD